MTDINKEIDRLVKKYQRPDSSELFRSELEYLVEQTIKNIGCNEGREESTETDQRNKLIEEILNDYKEQNNYGLQDILHTHLSDKLILDRKQVEEMYDSGDSIIKIIQDIQSLLPKKTNDSE